ncbi:MAG TPA: BTB/POZ domain-containing protein [Myxococcota bacterium]|nr:BTB/POZ domain-containing protein [Myxococcota bacterium]
MHSIAIFVSVVFLIAQSLFAADTQSITKKEDEIIHLNVGGVKFVTSISTLRKYEGLLAKMFDPSIPMKPSRTIDGGYFLDDNPEFFTKLLDFLRYDQIDFGDNKAARKFLPFANKYCPAMADKIETWISNRRKLAKLESYELLNKDGQKNWYLGETYHGEIVGGTDYGADQVTVIPAIINEYENRKVHKDLCYAWSGQGFSIYNIREHNLRIGETVTGFRNFKHLMEIDKFLPLKLIDKTEKVGPSQRYVCTFNAQGEYSIFSATTGKKMLPDKSFTTLYECVNAMRNAITNQEI